MGSRDTRATAVAHNIDTMDAAAGKSLKLIRKHYEIDAKGLVEVDKVDMEIGERMQWPVAERISRSKYSSRLEVTLSVTVMQFMMLNFRLSFFVRT